jgi:uncharacterized protein
LSETPAVPPQAPSLIEYPSAFPIKVMGHNVEGFAQELIDLARKFDAALDPSAVTLRPSKGGKYLGVTITVTATSREQLDALYLSLTRHPHVKMVL